MLCPLGTILGSSGTIWEAPLPLCGQSVDLCKFQSNSLTSLGVPPPPKASLCHPWGSLFPFHGRRKLKISAFLGHLVARSDFGMISEHIPGCLGWLKLRFRVERVDKITFSLKLQSCQLWVQFWWSFSRKKMHKCGPGGNFGCAGSFRGSALILAAVGQAIGSPTLQC